MPLCGYRVSWCGRVVGWSFGCWPGIRTCRSTSGCWIGCVAEGRGTEIGVWMRRSATAAKATEQEGTRLMTRPTTGTLGTALPGAEPGQSIDSRSVGKLSLTEETSLV